MNARQVALVTPDNADEDRYFLVCTGGCLVREVTPTARVNLKWAAMYARGHAVEAGHAVEILEAA